ncbi:MAG: ABC transporter ATP-binding protein, partial [Proteobacteria bacterium]|nr:ABC transporter ATP-binding protein [Pseudomonadota bacterium]
MVLKFLWQIIKTEKCMFYSSLCIFISSGFALCFPLLLGNVVDSATSEDSNFQKFVYSCLMFAGIGLLKHSTEFVSSLFSRIARPSIRTRTTAVLYGKVAEKSVDFISNHNSGNLANKVNNVYFNITYLYHYIVHGIFMKSVMLIGYLCILYYTTPKLCMVLILISILFILVFYKLSISLKAKEMVFSGTKDKLSGFLVDSITNVLLVKSFNGMNGEDQNLKDSLKNMKAADKDIVTYYSLLDLFQQSLSTIVYTITISYCGYLVFEDKLSVANFVVLSSVVMNISGNLRELVNQIKDYFKTAGTLENTLKTVLQETDIKDKPNAKKLKLKKASIEFKNVDFKYSDGKDYIFKGFDLEISAGQKLGLVGKSGEGKSSLIKI